MRRDRTVTPGRERRREDNAVVNDERPRHFNHATEDFHEPGIPLLTSAQRVALNDLQAHAPAWRSALEHSLAVADYDPPIDDRSYWKHEIAVLDRTVAALKPLDTL